MGVKVNKFILGMASTNCYYIYAEGVSEAIVIDPADRGQYIYDKITEKGLKVAAVLLTHGHFDHILGANKLRDLTGVKIYANVAEKEICESPSMNISSELGEPCSVKADEYLEDGDELVLAGLNIRMIATPGHTSGGACYYFYNEGILISGDTLFQESVGRTDFPTGNMQILVKSIRDKLFTLPEETKVYPGHGEPTSILSEKQYNPFVRV